MIKVEATLNKSFRDPSSSQYRFGGGGCVASITVDLPDGTPPEQVRLKYDECYAIMSASIEKQVAAASASAKDVAPPPANSHRNGKTRVSANWIDGDLPI